MSGFKVCIHPTNQSQLAQWDFALSNFVPDVLYVVRQEGFEPESRSNVFRDAEFCSSVLDVPGRHVVLAPESGRYVQGEQSLFDFEHPADATYVFGADNRHLDEVVEGSDLVFIPTDTIHEMFSWVAYGVVMWDRRLKHG